MSRRILDPLPGHIVDRQRRAADPGRSVWVSANAGSGKTYVLTERVLRLMLTGEPPEAILCLTYTKAAAAVMRARIAERLADWALAGEADLARKLTALEGVAPSDAALRRARTLFAHALDTPGGLRIMTIHAFCESVLHRFPVEAGVPVDFTVLEQADRDEMVLSAREAAIAAALKGEGPVVAAVETLFGLLSDHQIAAATDCALAESRKLRPILADPAAAKARLRERTGFPGKASEAIRAEMAAGYPFSPADHQVIFASAPATASGRTFLEALAAVDPDAPEPDALCAAFLTDAGQPYRHFPDRTLRHDMPQLAARLVEEAQRLADLCQKLNHAQLIERSEALIDLLGAIVAAYEEKKRARSLLDFDDLIEKACLLFADRASGAWVRYKLDAAISHILVDESQDTNPEQWAVVRALAEEFFVGDSAVTRPRTLFAVGDEKQSIYSFQGAEPRLFGELGRDYQRRAPAVDMAFSHVPLTASFRTLPAILGAVDRIFANEDQKSAVLAVENVEHDTARAEQGGLVTLWPPVQQQAVPVDPDAWPLAASREIEQTAERQVAERIATEIALWVRAGRPLGPRGRPVTYDDVLILVQSRGALFRELIRALSGQGIPTPGADQLPVSDHMAVLDLLALGDVLVNAGEDLQLAALLRSPLFDVSEEQLREIAHDRRGTLWRALEASGLPTARAAFGRLHAWRASLDFERPYTFFAQVLYAEGGLRRFHARLGSEVDDVFSEFLALALAHEQSEQPSLVGFLAAMRGRAGTIGRELPERGAGVRVMTVHGAKGLESPIVILADAASKPTGQLLARPVIIAGDERSGPVLVHASKAQHVDGSRELREAHEQAQREEYWRKLYVAMTRAEDELYVTGPLTPGTDAAKQLEGTWYEAICTTFRSDCTIETDADGRETALVYPAERPAAVPAAAAPAELSMLGAPLVPPPLPEAVRREIVRPSSAFAGAERTFDTAAEGLIDAEQARREGLALHALLHHLGRLPRADWPSVGLKAMPVLLPDRPDRHESLLGRALSILTRPELAFIFGPDSRPELPFLIDAVRDGRPVRIAGRMDRLLVEEARVLVVDFKSDAAPPPEPAATPAAYRTQLGLYALVARRLFPDKIVAAAILWTARESLMFLPPELLADSVVGFTVR